MREELEQKLFDDFPSFFRNRDKGPKATLMVFGFACSDGWYDLIYKLCADIQKLLEKSPKLKKEFIVLQVKEKFGGLRFYAGYGTEKIFDRIRKAENDSYKICEICGKPGVARWDLPWIRTLCGKHYNKLLEALNEESKVLRVPKKEGTEDTRKIPAKKTKTEEEE